MSGHSNEFASSFYPSEHFEDELDAVDLPLANKVKTIAFYLPQFHAIQQNDEWWGKGFTEWTNVTRAIPLFEGHHQPHLPLELGFYNLTQPSVIRQQAGMAKKHGVDGFCFYHYWFSGERLLERPFEIFLKNVDIDIEFCVCWANENWTRRWDGKENEILVSQQHSATDDLRFINELLPVFSDSRYIRIAGRPLLIVYRADLFPDFKSTVALWKHHAVVAGESEPYVVVAQTFGMKDPRLFDADAAVEFPPHGLPDTDITKVQSFITDAFFGKISNYEQVVDLTDQRAKPPYHLFRTAFPGWDNTARKGLNCHAFANHSPSLFQRWLENNIRDTRECMPASEQLMFINAWNEWAEGAHLEPDQHFGFANLNALVRAHCVATDLSHRVSVEAVNRQYPQVISRNEFFDSFCEYYFVELCFSLIRDKIFDVQIYGAGEGGRQLIKLMKQSGYPFKIHRVLDQSAADRPYEVEGFIVYPPCELRADITSVVIASKAFKDQIATEIKAYLTAQEWEHHQIYC